jgi:hypothetical protein
MAAGSFAGAQSAGPTPDDRVRPESVDWKITPSRTTAPYTFTVSGRVKMPAGPPGRSCPPGRNTGEYCLPLPRERACDGGQVAIRYKGGTNQKDTISLRRDNTRIRGSRSQPPFCTFSDSITFTKTRRLRPNGQLKVSVRFLGNEHYKTKQGPSRFVRAKLPRRR